MYRVTCDNVTLYDTRDEDLVLSYVGIKQSGFVHV